MLGKTHAKVGAMACVIASAIPFINTTKNISLLQVCVAGTAALLVDADSQHSLINRYNPAIGASNNALEILESLIKLIIRLIIGVGGAIFIFQNSKLVMNKLLQLGIKHNLALVTYGLALIFIIIGISGEKTIKRIPVIGGIYELIASELHASIVVLKRIMMILIYTGAGLVIIFYNFKHGNDFVLYLAAVLCFAIAIFPHRSFLHSTEGFALFTIVFTHLFRKIGYTSLIYPFVIGYGSHLYLTDMLTKEGIPVSSIPMILRKIGLHEKLEKYKVYRVIFKILDIRLVVPLISTGSYSGNLFESLYCILFLIITITVIVNFHLNIRLI